MAVLDSSLQVSEAFNRHSDLAWHKRRDVRTALLAGLTASAIAVVATTPFVLWAFAALDGDSFMAGLFEAMVAVAVAVLAHLMASTLWMHRRLKKTGHYRAGTTALVMLPVSLLVLPATIPLVFLYPLYLGFAGALSRLIVTARSGKARLTFVVGLLAVLAVQPLAFWLATQS